MIITCRFRVYTAFGGHATLALSLSDIAQKLNRIMECDCLWPAAVGKVAGLFIGKKLLVTWFFPWQMYQFDKISSPKWQCGERQAKSESSISLSIVKIALFSETLVRF